MWVYECEPFRFWRTPGPSRAIREDSGAASRGTQCKGAGRAPAALGMPQLLYNHTWLAQFPSSQLLRAPDSSPTPPKRNWNSGVAVTQAPSHSMTDQINWSSGLELWAPLLHSPCPLGRSLPSTSHNTHTHKQVLTWHSKKTPPPGPWGLAEQVSLASWQRTRGAPSWRDITATSRLMQAFCLWGKRWEQR